VSTTPSIADWAQAHFPRLEGRHAVVTGAASGIGLASARALAALGARLTVIDMNAEAGDQAARTIAADSGTHVEFAQLDLSDLDAVQRFCAAGSDAVDILINNAGILPPLRRKITAKGHELAFAISVFGHFALTAGLWSRLSASAAGRVVWLSSLVHRRGHIDLDDLHGEGRYEAQRAYNQAKLASLMLAVETEVRAREAGSRVVSLAAHPGVARTGIGHSRDGQVRRGMHDYLTDAAFHTVMRLLGRPPERAAQPIVQAAVDITLPGGSLYGPGGLGEMAGRSRVLRPAAVALDRAARSRLWEQCETATGMRIDMTAPETETRSATS